MLTELATSPLEAIARSILCPTKGMDDATFVRWCYQSLLCRLPNDADHRHWMGVLASGTSREDVILSFLESPEYGAHDFESREGFAPGHFYSAVPSHADRARLLDQPRKSASIPGVDLRERQQIKLLKKLTQFLTSCPLPTQRDPKWRYCLQNNSYAMGDGLILDAMIRHIRPRRLIEVGSGNSSCALLDINDAAFSSSIDLTFIEPYPELLHSLIRHEDRRRVTIIDRPVQSVPLEIFAQLEAGDVLFIDSTHVMKLGSDVNRYFAEILPSLRKGVYIHFHDIQWPFEYPHEWIRDGRAWNEAYALRAFLQYNRVFEIELFPSFLVEKHRSWFESNCPNCLKELMGAFWMRKVKR